MSAGDVVVVHKYHLPNGKQTTSAKVYEAAMMDLVQPFREFSGCSVVGFVPGVSILLNGHSLVLPCNFFLKFNRMFERAKLVDRMANALGDTAERARKKLPPWEAGISNLFKDYRVHQEPSTRP